MPNIDVDSKSQLIYDTACRFLGTKEWPGPRTNPEIAKMFGLAPEWLNQDDSQTPWCGIFRGYIGYLTATGMPEAHYRAKNWLKWGLKTLSPVQGTTIVMSRPGGNHVGVVDHFSGDYVYVLGGNQSNAVTIARFRRSIVLGYVT